MVGNTRFLFAACVIFGAVPLETATVNSRQDLRGKNSNLLQNGPRVTDSLKFVVVISRHGNRPLKDYPLDPYPVDNPNNWPYGADQLTKIGRKQLYRLGRKVRFLYEGFISPTYTPQELHASSINLQKTLMSGEAFLAGLYPVLGGKSFQIWNPLILWQPTALSSDSLDNTAVIDGCPKYVEETQVVAMKFIKTHQEDIGEMITYFNEVTGLNVSGLQAVKTLYHLGDKLSTEDLEGYKLPAWTTSLYPDPLIGFLGQIYLNLYAGTFDTTRLLIGNFFGEMMEAVQGKANGSVPEERKIHYYSGHDSSLVALQVVLGVAPASVIGWVKPGSALALELHQDPVSGHHYVEVILVDGYSQKGYLPILLPETDLETLINNTVNYTNVDYDQECLASSGFTLKESSVYKFFG